MKTDLTFEFFDCKSIFFFFWIDRHRRIDVFIQCACAVDSAF